MTVTELIAALEQFREQHGDLPIETERPWGRDQHPGPKLAYAKVLSGRESRDRFWIVDSEKKGEPLCKM